MRRLASMVYKFFDEKSTVAHARFCKKIIKSRCKPNKI